MNPSPHPPPGAETPDPEEEIAGFLAESLRPASVPPERVERIRMRMLEKVRAIAPSFITVRAGTEDWVELLPKVHAKRLHSDGLAESYLVRLEPGARAPAHGHPAGEECLVLEGSVRYVGAETLVAGDFQYAPAGAQHSELVSDGGALVFLRYARPVTEYINL